LRELGIAPPDRPEPCEAASGDVADRYAASLVARRLAPTTVARYVRVTAHFTAWWTLHHRADVSAIRKKDVDAFVSSHLGRCRCPSPVPRTPTDCRAALHHLARLLPPGESSIRPPTLFEEEVARYDAYLREVCGAADQTRIHRTRHVREFLSGLFGRGRVSHREIRPQSLRRFVVARSRSCRPSSAGVITDGLRSYVRYLELQGLCGPGLRDAIPCVARWRLATLPRCLEVGELTRFLGSFDRQSPRGRRDYAMALCLAALGLRASEVAALRLRDLDWRSGTLIIRESKTRRGRTLPLMPRVGRALVTYLRVRPQTKTDHVFVRIGVLEGDPIGPSVVRSAVRLAYKRAGLPAHYTGTHILRHTAATRLINAGASIKEIADVLGHASLDSTSVYAKLDVPRLRAVALPWVEAEP
jgi:integrase/recombinase XerD